MFVVFVLVWVARLRSTGHLLREVRDLPPQLPDDFSPVTTNTSGKVVVVGFSLRSLPPTRVPSPRARSSEGSGVLARILAISGPDRKAGRCCDPGCFRKPRLQHLSARLDLGRPQALKVASLVLACHTSLRFVLLRLLVVLLLVRRLELVRRHVLLRGCVVVARSPVLG